MKDAIKVCFLDAPISQTGLFGGTFWYFTQVFCAVWEQLSALTHLVCSPTRGIHLRSQHLLHFRNQLRHTGS